MKPNFFIAGAPKSGTTALYEYLRHHPDVCMPAAKEPHYFATDFTRYPRITSESEYLRLFRKCDSARRAVGEASVWYLYSKDAIANIRGFRPDAKIIVMLRNPVELAHSMHAQALYNFNEIEADFETAWSLQAQRRRGECIPEGCRAEQILQYRALASLGEQVERLYSVFPDEQVKLIFFDDFRRDTRAVYESVLEFLGLPGDGRTEFLPVNESKTHRSHALGWLLQTPPRPVISLVRFMRSRLGLDINPLLARARRLNDRSVSRAGLSPEFRQRLRREFADDVGLLERRTGRDLRHWLSD